jgi:hypothetical protein
MELFRNIKTACLALLAFSLITLNFNGCNQDTPLNVIQDDSDSHSGTLGKRTKRISTSTTTSGNYPQLGSCEVKYFPNWSAYNGGLINIPNGSQFSFLYGALTPPASQGMGNKVTINMQVDKYEPDQQLIFTFGPSGCQFDPVATIWLSWSDLTCGGVPNLYLIDENGNYHPQLPEEVDLVGKRLRIGIHHFSRYAVAFSQ